MPAQYSIASLAERVRSLEGWRAHGVAFAAGALGVLAMAPFFVWPVLWVSLPTLVWLMEGACGRSGDTKHWRRGPESRAALLGWWFGLGYFLAGLFWIGEAFLVEAETFAVLLPFAVMLMPAGLALFYAAATALAVRLASAGARRVLVLALTLSVSEWLRGHVLSGFPWNVLGYALTYPLPLMQSAAVLGIYGLTLATVLIFALPPVLWAGAASGAAGRRLRAAAIAVAIGPIAIAALLGQVRLSLATQGSVPGVKLRIVQPSVPQREKWQPENQRRIFDEHLELSGTNAAGQPDRLAGVTHVLWPEAAMPFLPLDYPQVRSEIGELLPAGTLLIAGALRAEPAPANSSRTRRIFNSLLVFGERGSLIALYDKIHLVPFGEYLPLQRQLEAIGLQQLSRLRGGFDAGVRPRPLLNLPGLPPAVPLICYEVIFPGAVVQGGERPSLMLNLTNDGWFGNTTGPRQHLHQARVRAVEEGLPIIRAANNGISAVIDAQGRVLARLGMNMRGVIDAGLPVSLPAPLYARAGDFLFAVVWLICAALIAVVGTRAV